MNNSKSPKDTKKASFFQEINNFSKNELLTIFFSLEYAGQNQDSGLGAKKSGVVFSKPKLLIKKHGGL